MSDLGVDMVVLFGPNIARDNEELRVPYSTEYKLYSYIEEQAISKRWKCIVTTPWADIELGLENIIFSRAQNAHRLGRVCI